jgi:hypothetical protein
MNLRERHCFWLRKWSLLFRVYTCKNRQVTKIFRFYLYDFVCVKGKDFLVNLIKVLVLYS